MSAKVLLCELRKGKKIINIDETWIGELDYRKQKWRKRGCPNTVTAKEVTPRLTLIAAVDTQGKIYLAMT